eukprot:g10009.t1
MGSTVLKASLVGALYLRGVSAAPVSGILDAHNGFRELHDADPLVYDATLEANAQVYADVLANSCGSLVHDPALNGEGENLYSCTFIGTPVDDSCLAGTGATQAWYDEVQFYVPGETGTSNTPGEAIGHFTQVVWKSSTTLGCAATACEFPYTGDVTFFQGQNWQRNFVVCRYAPPGNYLTQYYDNVSILCNGNDDCDDVRGEICCPTGTTKVCAVPDPATPNACHHSCSYHGADACPYHAGPDPCSYPGGPDVRPYHTGPDPCSYHACPDACSWDAGPDACSACSNDAYPDDCSWDTCPDACSWDTCPDDCSWDSCPDDGSWDARRLQSSDEDSTFFTTDGYTTLGNYPICSEDVCCEGGDGCSARDGGEDFTGHEACCKSGVVSLGRVCSATVGAPCIVSDGEVCMAGVSGILYKDEVCCPTSCGSCAGDGCSARDGGDDFTGHEACCKSGVVSLGRICSPTVGAPCIVSDGEVCMAGVSGILYKDEVCCPTSCGSCAGDGCSARDGGDDFTGHEACCKSGVMSLGRVCSDTVGAPCIVSDAPTCSNGLPGYEAADVCCPLSCGRCGGSGCSKLGDGCCTRGVKESGDLCSVTKAAPCNIDDDVSVDDDSDNSEGEVCTAGVLGILEKGVCCPTSCESCGGSGCSGRDGGDSYSGSEACCLSGVKSLGRTCSANVAAPCVVG